jgi:hypothetical protein
MLQANTMQERKAMIADRNKALAARLESEVEVLTIPRSGGKEYLTGSASAFHVGGGDLIFSVHDAPEKQRGVNFQITIPRDLLIALARAAVDDALNPPKPRLAPSP